MIKYNIKNNQQKVTLAMRLGYTMILEFSQVFLKVIQSVRIWLHYGLELALFWH